MRHRKILRTWLAGALCGVLAAPAIADTQAALIQALESRLEANARVIEKLAARVAELERKSAGAGAGAAVATPPSSPAQTARAAPASTLSELQENVAQLAESMSRRSGDAGLALHGFADVGAAWSSRVTRAGRVASMPARSTCTSPHTLATGSRRWPSW